MVYLASGDRYQKMEFRRCGDSGLKLPAISLGLWHNFGDATLIENSRQLLRHAFDLGITHFDIANNYGPPPALPSAILVVCYKKIFCLTGMN
jgi:L-glyceraldehyde 3-phosphate reductase